jgi:hypothetical protein
MVDEGFFNVFQMKILSGRVFSPEFKSDSTNFIVNEKAVQVMGMKVSNAVGKSLSLWDNKGTIIGVVKDFNYKPIQQPIEPMILALNRWGGHRCNKNTTRKNRRNDQGIGKDQRGPQSRLIRFRMVFSTRILPISIRENNAWVACSMFLQYSPFLFPAWDYMVCLHLWLNSAQRRSV